MEIILQGESSILRTVLISDAEFIANMRSDPKVYKYLSSINAVTIEEQENWIRNNQATQDGFYFIIENIKTGMKTGTISIYNLEKEKKRAEFGRYIAMDSVNAIEAELMLLKFGFCVMGLDFIYCRTADLNTKVWKQHLHFGFKDIGTEFLSKKNLLLRLQQITINDFKNFDYSKLQYMISRMSKLL